MDTEYVIFLQKFYSVIAVSNLIFCLIAFGYVTIIINDCNTKNQMETKKKKKIKQKLKF